MRRLGPARDRAPFWRTVGRFALYGPLLGGAPYAWLVITLPFIYGMGLLPAALAGVLYALWLHAPGRRAPNRAWRAAMGAVCGLAGCAAAAVVAQGAYGVGSALLLVVLALHGVPAALVLALTEHPADDRVTTARPAATAAAVPGSAPAAA